MQKDKRAQILEASVHLFAERGYHATTIPMIADQAKVGAGTIYRYFENKETLVNELFQEYIVKLKQTILQNYPTEEADVQTKFNHLFLAMVSYADEHLQALYFIDSHSNDHCLDAKSLESYQSLLELFDSFIKEGQKKSLIKPLPSYVLIVMVFGAFLGYYKFILRGHFSATDQLMDEFKKCCWDAISLH
jgi:TetR/AcrR family transcriptional regulator, repressor of fatR-cypB operon